MVMTPGQIHLTITEGLRYQYLDSVLFGLSIYITRTLGGSTPEIDAVLTE
jgi:hypothetical protein